MSRERAVALIIILTAIAVVGIAMAAMSAEGGRLVKRKQMETGAPTKVTLTRHCVEQ